LYIPLKDDEECSAFCSSKPRSGICYGTAARAGTTILANQATVALRNAQPTNSPAADTLGAIHAKKEAFLPPTMRRLTWAVIAAVVIASLTLIQWPLRVEANQPVFRPNVRTEIRPLVDGVVERVFVGEGARVARGDPIVQLRDAEQRTSRDAALSDAASAEREAATASARGDAAEERLQRMRRRAGARSGCPDQKFARRQRSPVAGSC
jgi:multidrug efflux pump subunit AcrA (membrane-fusion protein)